MKKIRMIPLLVALTLFAGCASTKSTHGQIIGERQLSALKPNVHQRADVAAILGSPSATSTLNDGIWYYVTATSKIRPLIGKQIGAQETLIVHFDDKGTLTHLSTRNSETDGQDVMPKEGSTPTQGKELGVMEQLIQNLGLGL